MTPTLFSQSVGAPYKSTDASYRMERGDYTRE